jgi:hypothetical protein
MRKLAVGSLGLILLSSLGCCIPYRSVRYVGDAPCHEYSYDTTIYHARGRAAPCPPGVSVYRAPAPSHQTSPSHGTGHGGSAGSHAPGSGSSGTYRDHH